MKRAYTQKEIWRKKNKQTSNSNSNDWEHSYKQSLELIEWICNADLLRNDDFLQTMNCHWRKWEEKTTTNYPFKKNPFKPICEPLLFIFFACLRCVHCSCARVLRCEDSCKIISKKLRLMSSVRFWFYRIDWEKKEEMSRNEYRNRISDLGTKINKEKASIHRNNEWIELKEMKSEKKTNSRPKYSLFIFVIWILIRAYQHYNA